MKSYRLHSLGHGGWTCNNTIMYLIPYIWVVLFLVLPLVIVIKISISEPSIGDIPPYKSILIWNNQWFPSINITFSKFKEIIYDSLYLKAYFFSLKVACLTTLITFLIGYPMAYAISNLSSHNQYKALILILVPFWTSFLVRVYAWIAILKDKGFLNYALIKLGIINDSIHILNTELAIYIGMVYTYLPFMIIPIYSSLSQINKSMIEAARNLGCTRIQAFWKIIFPMSIKGIYTGCILVFIPSLGDFVIADILGGSNSITLGSSLWLVFFNQIDWPGASVIAILMIALIIPVFLFEKDLGKK